MCIRDRTDSRRLTMEFGDVRMERHRTLVEIGMCDQAVFGVLGVAEAQEAEREAKVVFEDALEGPLASPAGNERPPPSDPVARLMRAGFARYHAEYCFANSNDDEAFALEMLRDFYPRARRT
eukprot:TRINITY_DN4725_c0_g2_i2.p1 TRINITY_DN4725_c0_g2~~TRINITY_DN4725_c0_g2_i2.p1  ORF type:complete len:122 (+),score=19.07 TRINITY_DN4725_c0_g2_i2:83-448(+)